ncbi:MAG: lamin tail domain-containing protein, partial [Planctomycetes bacterium]|nr:lamin tail domain-containing protein [Planctomycetota bacterium]
MRAEPLEPRLFLDATVSIAAVAPDPRNTVLDEISIQFSEPISGFDVGDLILTRDGAGGVQTVNLNGVAQLSNVGGQSFTLGNLAGLTTGDGDYQLTLDVVNSGITDAQNQPLVFEGTGFGPELIVNSSFDTDLSGWLFPNGGVIWQDNGGDGEARITSLHPGTPIPPPPPDGAASAKIRQGFTTTPLTNYQLEFDLVTRQVVTELSGTNVKLQVLNGNPATGGLLFGAQYSASQNGHQVLEFTTEPDDQGITVQFIASKTARDFTVDNVSVRRLVRGPSIEWTMDATPPTVSIVAISPDPRRVPLSSATIIFNEPVSGFTLSDLTLRRDGTPISISGVASLTSPDQTNFTLSNLASLTGTDGIYSLSVGTGLQDLATNQMTSGNSDTWVMDTVAPTITVNSKTENDSRSPELTGTVGDSNATVVVRVDRQNYTANVNGNTWALPAGTIDPPLSDGTFNVVATVTDQAGNSRNDSTSAELTLDAAPVVTVDINRTADTTPRVTGTIDDPNATISELTINGETYTNVTNNRDGTWVLPDNVITDALAVGTYNVSFVASDTTGHSTGDVTVTNILIILRPIVINEILFRPSAPIFESGRLPLTVAAGNAEPTSEEYVELYNNSEIPIDVSGWKFTRGFSYTIPQGTIIPARGYLVVASDVTVFLQKYGAVPLLVGGDGSGDKLTDWIGTLSNSGENIRFERPGGDRVDQVRYADSGDWAVRRLEVNTGGQLGWVWDAPHDDDGHSVELMNPDLTNREGQNWAPSAAPLGTPGRANSVASGDIAPMLLDVQHSPAIPRSTDIDPDDGVPDDVVISARIVNEAESGVDVTLFYRINPTTSTPFNPNTATPFEAVTMNDEGLDGDATAGDGIFSATVPAQANRAIVDFYVEASEHDGANVRSYPSPSDDAGNHAANLLFQFDDSIVDDFGGVNGDKPWPVNQPIYRIIQTAEQAQRLTSNTQNTSPNRQNHQQNGTFIVHDPTRGVDVDNGDLVSYNLDDATVSILFRENLFVGGENIDAAHVRDATNEDGSHNIILSTTRGATLGGLTFRNGDLIEYNPLDDTATLLFSEDAFGTNEDIDAIWVKEEAGRITELIFSTATNFTVDGDVFLNGDLVKVVIPNDINLNDTPLRSFAGLSVTRVLTEDEVFAAGANIDGVHKDGNDFLISTTGSELIGDLIVTNGSVIRVDPNNLAAATIFFDESEFGDGNEDIDALALFVDQDGIDQLVLSTEGNNARLGSDIEIFYNIGIRNRGNASRGRAEQNLRVAFPKDHRFRGESALPMNTDASFSQVLGMTIHREAGLSAEVETKAVQVRRNGINDANINSVSTYGAYAQLQSRDGNLPEVNYPLDSGGNFYSINDRGVNGSLVFAASPDAFKSNTAYLKKTNSSADDWNDLVELTRALNTAQTPNSTAQDSLNFVHKVSQTINVSQWLRHMALMALIRNEEGGIATGRGDDYSLYRGEFDTRVELVPHDLDAIMNIRGGAGFGGSSGPILQKRQATFPALFRVIEHPAFFPIFAGHLIDLMDNVYNPENLNPIIDELFGEGTVEGRNDWLPTNIINQFKNYIVARNIFVRNQIDRNLAGIPDPVSPNDLSQLPAAFQSLADQQRYLRISEIMYNPRGEELEFVELINMGDAPLDLTGVHFKGGILFGFNNGAPIESPIEQTPLTILDAGERVLIVKDRAAFLAHNDPDGSKNLDAKIAGEFWNGRLSNSGEQILLEGRLGEPILDFSYDDNWYDQTDGEGFSLVLRDDINANTPRSAWGEKTTWRASGFSGGSPGTEVATDSNGNDRIEHHPDDVRINEILSHTDRAGGDWVELHNTTDVTVDIGGWYLSDSGNNLRKFRIPDGTTIAGGGFVTFNQFGIGGFGVNSATDDDGIVVNPLGNPGA